MAQRIRNLTGVVYCYSNVPSADQKPKKRLTMAPF